jgi:hypothetical protein
VVQLQEPPTKLPMNRCDLDNGPPRIVILPLRRRRLHVPPVCTARSALPYCPPGSVSLRRLPHCTLHTAHCTLHTAHCCDGACLLGPRRLSSRLIRRRSPTRPGPATLHPRIRSSTIRHDTTPPQHPSLAPSPGPPLCDRLATAVSPTRSSILTPASQPHTIPQPAGCPPPSTAPPSSCPAHPVGASRGHTWARGSVGVQVDAHAVPAARPGLRRPARSHKTPCRPL